VIIWALPSDEQAQFVDLGPDYYASHTNPERRVRHHVRDSGRSPTPSPSTRRPDRTDRDFG
jgi:hypothetical protein